MRIEKSGIEHIAKLASLNLSPEEIESYTKGMEEILEYVDVLNSVDTEGVIETNGAINTYNVFRKDEVEAFEDTESLLQNAVTVENGMFKIPKVV